MKNLFDRISQEGINPNQLYVLYCIKQTSEPDNVNIHIDTRALYVAGLIDKNLNITSKGELFLQDCESLVKSKKIKKEVDVTDDFVHKYLELWPSKKLPSGNYARADKSNIIKNLKWFFTNYSYSMETVLHATALYVDTYALKNYKFMRTSQYFIRKSDSDKTISSDLANYCSIIESGDIPDTENPFEDKVV
jgi:hypothetical protein